MGQALIINRYKRVSHVINLEEFSKCIEQFHKTLQTFKYDDTLIDSLAILKSKLGQAQTKLNALTPLKRNKRGLINGLGSLVKAVTGNMDAEDAREIGKDIENIKIALSTVNTNYQTQDVFNNEILIRFENITNHINNEQVIITTFFENMQNKIYKEENTLEKLQYINRINYNLELLLNHLNDIIESMLLAKINVIPRFILTEQEIYKIKMLLENQNITIKSEQHIYDLLKMNTLSYENNIIFTIQIPIFEKDNYKIARLIPLPINNKYFVMIPNYLIYKNNVNKYYLTQNCPKVDDTFICNKDAYINTPQNDTCTQQLLDSKNSSCDVQERGPVADVFEAEKGYIFAFNANNLKAQLKNGSEITINGSAIIKYVNETIRINGIEYDNGVETTFEHLVLILPPLKEMTRNKTVEILSLQNIHLEAIETSNKILTIHQTATQHAWTLYILLGFVAILTVTAWLHRRTKHVFHVQDHNHHLPIYAPAIPSLWPSLQTGEGGVTTVTTPPKPPRLHH